MLRKIEPAVNFFSFRLRATVVAVVCAVAPSVFLLSCTNDPTPVGSSLYPPQNKLVLHGLDSFNPADSVSFTYQSILQHVANGSSATMLTGLYKTYEARDLLKLGYIVDTSFVFDSIPHMNMKSGYLELNLAGYRLGDTGATMQFSCTVNQILTNYESGATWDSLGALSNYSSTPVGSFTGTIGQDDSLLKIPLDTAFIMKLLRYGSFDSLNTYFQGIAILPQTGTSGITSFKISAASVHLVFQPDTTIDTAVMNTIQNIYIVNGNEINPPDEMVMQSGLVQRLHMYIAYPKVPLLSTINSASLQLALDTNNSLFGKDHFRDSLGESSRDTMFLLLASSDTTLGVYITAGTRISGTNTYTFPQIAPFLSLLQHGAANFGIVPIEGFGSGHGAGDEFSTLDRFAFYSLAAKDTNLRPHVKIFYSTQAQQ
ncbi:MAG TPA: hypothetical protein VFJ29_01995 [Candidatus Kapabacteria bacterium]|nr:hypothetical protein [Candidatus Kapabacteria bacterium]